MKTQTRKPCQSHVHKYTSGNTGYVRHEQCRKHHFESFITEGPQRGVSVAEKKCQQCGIDR